MEATDFYEKVSAFINEKRAEAVRSEIELFQNRRLEKLRKNHTLKRPYAEGPKLVIHLIPESAFLNSRPFDIGALAGRPEAIRPLGSKSHDQTFSFDGLLHYCDGPERRCWSYVQVFNNGIIEAVSSRQFGVSEEGKKGIYTGYLEPDIIEAVREYLPLQKKLGVNSVVLMFLSLLGVLDYKLFAGVRSDAFDKIHAIDETDLLFPAFVFVGETVTPEELKPTFDRLWNAAGYPRSYSYDEKGSWITR